MLRILIRKEILQSLLNRRFVALAVFSIALMPLSAFVNARYYDSRRQAFDAQVAAFESDRGPDDMRGFRAPSPLSVVAEGAEPFMPTHYRFGTTSHLFDNDLGTVVPGPNEALSFGVLSTYGTFDYLFLVQTVFGLLALMLAFDMISGEKERGTLRAILAHPVPRDRLLLGKLIGGFSVLWTCFLLGTLLALLVLVVFVPALAGKEPLLRFALIFAVSSLFLAGQFVLGLLGSALFPSSKSSILFLLILWVTLHLVVPKGAELGATVLRPVRSEEAVRIEASAVRAEAESEKTDRASALYERTIGQGTISWQSEEGKRFREGYSEIFEDVSGRMRERLDAIDRERERQVAARSRLRRGLSLLSPVPALAFLATDASGTGDLAYRSYREAIRDYHRVLDRTALGILRRSHIRIQVEGGMMGLRTGEAPDWESVPVFVAPRPGLGQVLAAHGAAVFSLFCYLLLPLGAAYVLVLRYDVR